MQQNHPPDNFTGLWVTRYPDDARCEKEYVNGVADGSYRYVIGNGVCIRESGLKNDQWHGTMIIRNSDGLVLDSSEFDEGTGVYRIFTSDGKLMDEIPMVRGKKHGLVRCWRGGKLAVSQFIDGEMQVTEPS